MNILVDVVHPADVHFFRHAIATWEELGHRVIVTARDKDVTLDLLRGFAIPFTVISVRGSGLIGMASELARRNLRMLSIARRERIDVFTGFSAVSAAQVGFFLRRPVIAYYDTEHARLINSLTLPFCDQLWTPECYPLDHGAKHRRFAGLKESAYLHPRRFTPDPALCRAAGLGPGPYSIIRSVSWEATHDRGYRGDPGSRLKDMVSALEAHGAVYVSSERPLPAELASHELRLPPHLLHHALAGARLVVGDGSTTVVEAALLGTPAIYASPLPVSYAGFLQQRFSLIHLCPGFGHAVKDALELAADAEARHRWAQRAASFWQWSEDVTARIVRTVLAVGGRTTLPE